MSTANWQHSTNKNEQNISLDIYIWYHTGYSYVFPLMKVPCGSKHVRIFSTILYIYLSSHIVRFVGCFELRWRHFCLHSIPSDGLSLLTGPTACQACHSVTRPLILCTILSDFIREYKWGRRMSQICSNHRYTHVRSRKVATTNGDVYFFLIRGLEL